MNTEVISRLEVLERLDVEWRALWKSSRHATFFQSPDWLLPWWSHFGSGELFVVTARRDGFLRALLPLFVLRDEESDESLGMLIGTGHSDYLDVVASDAAALPSLVATLAAHDCQLWDLQQLPPGSPLISADAAPFDGQLDDQDICPRLDLRNPAATARSAHFQKKLRYSGRQLAAAGSIEWIPATASNLGVLLDALFSLHAAQWRQRSLPGVLDDPVTQAFHRDVATRALARGTLRMYGLSLDGRTIGVWYGFGAKGTTSYYLSGYDPAYEAMSIGSLLIAYAISESIREGADTFDFLRGAEPYKLAWGATDRVNRRRQLFRT